MFAFDLGKDGDDFLLNTQGDPEDDDVTQVDDIIVTATQPPSGGPGGGGAGGGGGQGWPGEWGDQFIEDDDGIDQDPAGYSRCQDRAADTLAADINDEISRQPDSNRREYGALIWRDENGGLHRTRLLSGDNFRLTELGSLSPQDLGFDTWSQVVGLVHSHPTEWETEPGRGDWHPADPNSNSHLIWAGDWRAADFYISQRADWANFTMYVSYDGALREFDWWENASRSRNVEVDRQGEGTQSGDYRPGTACG